MRMVIVPEKLELAIAAAIDEALAGRPATKYDRHCIRQQLLEYYDEYGYLPEFDLREQKDTDER